MSTPPRRRRPDARRRKPEGGGWLPTVAMGLGVIVAGLLIGALLSVLLGRDTSKPPAPAALVTSTASPPSVPTRGPIAIATIVPRRPPRHSPPPASTPTLEPSVEPASPSPSLPMPVAVPASKPTRTPAAVAAVTAAPSQTALVTPAPFDERSSTPAPPPEPTTVPSTAAAVQAGASESAYDAHASAVVRRYVDALIRGDEKTAYGALGAGGGTLSEQAFLDPSARIVSLKVTPIDAANASVGCEIASAKGHYYATYHVTAATAGPYISAHDYIKV